VPATPPDAILQAALRYAEKWHVFPAPPGTKKSYKSAAHSDGRKWGKTRDLAEIRRDWERWPEANVGIPTGKDNGFWVMETDTRAGGHANDGEESLAALVAANGELPATLMARSPSGSIHYYFAWPDGDGAEIKNTAGKIGPGIDTRGEGGMVVAPPSNRGDGCYEWLSDVPVAPAPAWLVELARSATQRTAQRVDGETHCDLERLEAALKELPNPLPDDLDVDPPLLGGWENWNKVIMAIYAATGGTRAGLSLADDWSRKYEERYNEANTREKWRKLSQTPPTNIGAGFIFKLVFTINPNWDRISRDDFYFHMPSFKFLFEPTFEFWPKESVDARLPMVLVETPDGEKPIKASAWLGRNRPLDQTTWLPGKSKIIEHRLLTKEGVWIDRRGAKCYNLYRPPTLIPGDARLAGPWLDVVDKVVGPNRQHVLSWFAHRIQRSHEKINHALIVGGVPGIGKDSMIEPLRRAIGPHNCSEIDPARMLDKNNRWLQAVVLRVSEARDLGDMNRYTFYEHLKLYTASPPDVLNVQDKYIPAYPIANVVGLIITTNYKDGLYLPIDDRRTHVSFSDARVEDIGEDFFTEYWSWLNNGGDGHVLAYLRDFDLANFNPKAPPPKTDAFYEMVGANAPLETIDIANVIEVGMATNRDGVLEPPRVFNIVQFLNAIPLDSDLRDWANKNRKQLGRRFGECGYTSVPNPKARDGFWKINKTRTLIYVRQDLPRRDQLREIKNWIKSARITIAQSENNASAIAAIEDEVDEDESATTRH
jgi:hypothetical protein